MAAVSEHGAEPEEQEFSERELEVAAILADLPSIVRAQRRRQRRQELQRQQQARPEIPTWGRRRPRKAPAAVAAVSAEEKPAAAAAIAAAAAAEDDHRRRDGAASPDTPLAFHDDEGSAEVKKTAAHDEWALEQRGVVASLSHENAHLLKQIEEFRARLETSRSANDSLNQMQQSKHKKRHRPPPPSEEEEELRRKLQARAPAAADRPALDLNEPAEADAEDAKPPQIASAPWFHRGHQQQQLMMQQKAALTAAARRRRREIRRAKASSASRTRRLG